MILLKNACLIFSLLTFCLFSRCFCDDLSQKMLFLSLKGHLSKEEVAKAFEKLEGVSANTYASIILEVSSTSGDLQEVLSLAKKIYEVKQATRLPVTVYIDDSAVGPAAIFPFLSDSLMASVFVSWGDIPQGSETIYPTNLLRNRVTSLISSNNPHYELLNTLAQGMSDKNVLIIDKNGWKIAAEPADASFPHISVQGETLVINQQQLQKLGLVSKFITSEQFHQKFNPQKSKDEPEAKPQEVNGNSLEGRLKKHIIFDPQGPNFIGYIKIEDRTNGINQSTWLYVKTALDYYKKNKPIFVILELNTPGGEVFAAQKISDALKELDTQYNIPVITFINNWAISAGAMLAYSTRFITIVKDASMGAAEPVLAGQEGKMETASEKVNSALRADFGNRASFFGRNPLLAEAMVDKDVILVLRHGKITKLDNENQIRTTGTNPDKIISPKGKLLTLNAEQMMEYDVADILLPPAKLDLISDQEREAGKWPASKMLLFQHPFFKGIPQAQVDEYQMDWKTRFFSLLANPVVSSLLFLGLLLGFYMEMSSPGFGLPGTVAVTCLFLIILSSFALEAANWLELILLVAGIAIIAIDLFILPTFGLLGMIGVIFFLMGLFGLMLPGLSSASFEYDTKSFNAAGEFVFRRFAWLCGTLVLAIVMITILARYVMPRFTPFHRLVLSGGEQEGFIAGISPQSLPQAGAVGEVVATLRPSGKVVIQGTIYDAMTTGDFIEAGTSIRVMYSEGSSLVVTRDINGKQPSLTS